MPRRREFTSEDDDYLAQYIAKYNPAEKGRRGNVLYQQLVENDGKKWPWSKRHTWHSWRDRYVNNQERLDRRIESYLKRAGIKPPTPPPARSPSSSPAKREKRKRVPFTDEDDEHLIEFLAGCVPSQGSRLGQKLYTLLEDEQEYPWSERHPLQAWRQRYKNHEIWFDWAIRRYCSGDDFDEPPPNVPKPKTENDYHAPRFVSRANERKNVAIQSPAPEKRKRVSHAGDEAPPPRKARIQKQPPPEPEEAEPGPSQPRDVDNNAAADEQIRDIMHESQANAVGDGDQEEDEGEGGGDEGEDDDEENDEGEDDEDDIFDDSEGSGEDLGSIGSDDYRGEIALAPGGEVEASPGQDQDRQSVSGSSDEDEQGWLLTELLDPGQGEDRAMSMKPDNTAADADLANEYAQVHPVAEHVLSQPPILSNTPPSGVLPPRRRPNEHIQRNIDAAPSTPSMSPLEAAEVRHHRERSHTPAPVRPRVKRISRPTDDIFATPQPETSSTSGAPTTENSPTIRHVAHLHENQADVTEPALPKQREPPRLDEGAWNKAFSDVKGKARVEPSGKTRRRSGVNFEEEAEVIGVQDTFDDADPDQDGTDREEESSKTLVHWPPVRSKRKTAAPSTPMRSPGEASSQDPGSGRVVTTEKTITVRTMRTVERKVPRPSKGTPFPRIALAPATIESPSSPVQDQHPDDYIHVDEVEVAPSQHHPFSQPVLAPSIVASTSAGSTISGTGSKSRVDTELLAKMLGNNRTSDDKPKREPSPSKIERDAKRPKGIPILPVDRAVIQRMLNGHKKLNPPNSSISRQANPHIPRATVSPSPGHDDVNRYERFEERDQELVVPQTSPLADKSDLKRGTIGQIFQRAPYSHTPAAEQAGPSNGHSRRHTLARSVTPDVFSDDLKKPSTSRPRQSSRFTIGDADLSRRTALSLLFHPPRSGSDQPRSHTLPRLSGTPSSGFAPPRPADAEFADTLSARELDLVKALGVRTAVQTMALNHGFSEDTVRQVCAECRSLEKADHVLRRMRDGANEAANEELQSLHDDAEEEPMDVDPDAIPDGGSESEASRSGSAAHGKQEEVEVENALTQDGWLRGSPPAETAKTVASQSRRRSSARPFVFEPVPPERESSDELEYSPPKHTRAAHYVRRAQIDIATMDVDSDPAPAPPERELGLKDLAGLDTGKWAELERKMGPDGAKKALGKALAKLLRH